METLLKQLNQLSSNIIERLASCELEDIESYMEERDALFAELQQHASQASPSAELRSLIASIQQQDKVITGRMTELRDEANAELDKLNKSKRTRSVYDSDTYNNDGMFFDTRR